MKELFYASWGPIFWPFLRRTARALTIKAVRGTVAIGGILRGKGAVRSPYGGVRSPYRAIGSLMRGSVPLAGLF